MKRLVFGIVIFSAVALFLFFLLSVVTDWPVEIRLIVSLASGAAVEAFYYKIKRSSALE